MVRFARSVGNASRSAVTGMRHRSVPDRRFRMQAFRKLLNSFFCLGLPQPGQKRPSASNSVARRKSAVACEHRFQVVNFCARKITLNGLSFFKRLTKIVKSCAIFVHRRPGDASQRQCFGIARREVEHIIKIEHGVGRIALRDKRPRAKDAWRGIVGSTSDHLMSAIMARSY